MDCTDCINFKQKPDPCITCNRSPDGEHKKCGYPRKETSCSGWIEKISPINPDCKECKGTGNIRFSFDQDTTQTVVCPNCFPEEKEI